MSSEWEATTLGDILTLQRGMDLPVQDRKSGNIPIVASNGIAGYHNHAPVKAPGVVIGRSGSIGGGQYIESDFWPLNTTLWVKDFKGNDPRYCYYLLRSIDFSGHNVGSGVPTLNRNHLHPMPMVRPSVEVQKQISTLLGALDDRITLLRETNTTLEAIAQAMFKSWFVDFDPVHAKQQGHAPEGMDEATAALFPDSFEESELGLVPRGWSVNRLGDVVERITKGTTPSSSKHPFVESGINFVKVESLTEDGDFIPEKFSYIDNETHELLKRSQLKVDDVLITIAGTIGRIAVITEDFLPANTNQAVALIRPNAELFPSGLIKHFLQRDDSRQSMGERVVQAVQANLSLGSLSDLKLVIPPAEVVKQLYGAVIEKIDASKCANQQQVRTLINIRNTLLPRLISGQLRLPEAEVMLKVVA